MESSHLAPGIARGLDMQRVADLEPRFVSAVGRRIREGLFLIDSDARVAYANPVAGRLLGWRATDVVGRDVHDVVHAGAACPKPASPARCRLESTIASASERSGGDVFVHRNGSTLPVVYTCVPLAPGTARGERVLLFANRAAYEAERQRRRARCERIRSWRRIWRALEEDRLELHAQPIVDVEHGRTIRHELLVRMRERGGHLVAPAGFIPEAERHGSIVEIDRWVMRRAVALAADGHAVAFNLSPRSLATSRLLAELGHELERSGADPALLGIELTEAALLEDERLAEWIARCGCRLALDDFGTGYATFGSLKRLPVDTLKIDREFIRDLAESRASRAVVEAVAALADGLGLETVAEGVEREDTLTALRAIGVDYAQGFLLGRPVEAALLGRDPGGRA